MHFMHRLMSKTVYKNTKEQSMETKLTKKITPKALKYNRSWRVQQLKNHSTNIGSRQKYTNLGGHKKIVLWFINALSQKITLKVRIHQREIHGTKKKFARFSSNETCMEKITPKGSNDTYGREAHSKNKYFSSSTLLCPLKRDILLETFFNMNKETTTEDVDSQI